MEVGLILLHTLRIEVATVVVWIIGTVKCVILIMIGLLALSIGSEIDKLIASSTTIAISLLRSSLLRILTIASTMPSKIS